MEEKTKQDKEFEMPFSALIRTLDPDKGLTAWDYLEALDCHVKGLLQLAYLELCELIYELPRSEMKRADSFLQIQQCAFMLWEQMDKKVMEDYQTRRATCKPKI
jgi:hypothetical protein